MHLAPCWCDWQLTNRYEIYLHWRHRYAPGVTQNTEHVFGLCSPRGRHAAPQPARAHRLCLAALDRGGRPLLLAVQCRGQPSCNCRATCPAPPFRLADRETLRCTTVAVPGLQGPSLRVATYNIQGRARPRAGQASEIHNLAMACRLDADLVFLQEVRHFHHGHAVDFERTWFGWLGGQAEFLAPQATTPPTAPMP